MKNGKNVEISKVVDLQKLKNKNIQKNNSSSHSDSAEKLTAAVPILPACINVTVNGRPWAKNGKTSMENNPSIKGDDTPQRNSAQFKTTLPIRGSTPQSRGTPPSIRGGAQKMRGTPVLRGGNPHMRGTTPQRRVPLYGLPSRGNSVQRGNTPTMRVYPQKRGTPGMRGQAPIRANHEKTSQENTNNITTTPSLQSCNKCEYQTDNPISLKKHFFSNHHMEKSALGNVKTGAPDSKAKTENSTTKTSNNTKKLSLQSCKQCPYQTDNPESLKGHIGEFIAILIFRFHEKIHKFHTTFFLHYSCTFRVNSFFSSPYRHKTYQKC